MKQPRIPTDYPRINIVSAEAKEQILEISERTGESMKEIIVRLVAAEHERLGGE